MELLTLDPNLKRAQALLLDPMLLMGGTVTAVAAQIWMQVLSQESALQPAAYAGRHPCRCVVARGEMYILSRMLAALIPALSSNDEAVRDHR